MTNENRKSKSKLIIIILAIAVVLFGGGLGFYLFGISAAEPGNTDEVIVTVESGSGALMVLEDLDEAGLVKNKLCAKILVKVSGFNNIQANTYAFSKDMPLTKIFVAMEEGDPDYLSGSKVTIIEGANIPQAAAEISAVTGVPATDIIALWADPVYLKELIDKYWFLTDEILNADILYPLEGYLYPETYFASGNGSTDDLKTLTERMLDKTDQEITPYKEDISAMDMTVHGFLSFASVVERESLFEDDRPMIAGVFLNRLNTGMPLQSDITVLYAKQERRVDVSYADLEVDSPYNTYKHAGLPIGPVCAVPGHTMDDVLNYEKSDYLFFFATEDGKVLYSKTVEEHNKIVEENVWY